MSADRELLLAILSHELRTPVTAIRGFAQTLGDHWDALEPDERREAVAVIRQRADELARLVDRLLATLTDPAGPLELAPFDLAGALREGVADLGGDLRERLRATLPTQLPAAYGLRSSLPAVLTELVTNATRYSAGPVELLACADPRVVMFQVADNGGADQPARGTGRGLALVKQLVERQHGELALRPRDGGGTVAEVRLPRADAGRPAPGET